MHCLSAPPVSRKTSAADDECWGNASLLPESQARACWFSTQATLCKKHYDEKKQQQNNLMNAVTTNSIVGRVLLRDETLMILILERYFYRSAA